MTLKFRWLLRKHSLLKPIYICVCVCAAWRVWSSNMIVLCLIIRLRDNRKASEKTSVAITCAFFLVAEICLTFMDLPTCGCILVHFENLHIAWLLWNTSWKVNNVTFIRQPSTFYYYRFPHHTNLFFLLLSWLLIHNFSFFNQLF